MELELRVVWRAGHRVVARRCVGKGQARILTARKYEGFARDRCKPDPLDIVSGLFDAHHMVVESPHRMAGELFVAAYPCDSKVCSRQSAAGKDQSLALLFIRERKSRMVE